MGAPNDIILSKQQAEALLSKNVRDQVIRTMNALISDKVEAFFREHNFITFGQDKEAAKSERQQEAKGVIGTLYNKLISDIPDGGITVAQLEAMTAKFGKNIATRNAGALGLSGEQATTLTATGDDEKLSAADLGKLQKTVSIDISDDMLELAGYKAPEAKPPVAVAVAAPEKPKVVRPRTPATIAPVITDEAAETALATQLAAEEEAKKSKEQQEAEAARLAEVQKRVDEENKQRLASAGVTGNTEEAVAGKDGGGLFGNINGIGDIFKLLADIIQKFIVGPNVKIARTTPSRDNNIEEQSIDEEKPKVIAVENLPRLNGVSTDGQSVSLADVRQGVVSTEASAGLGNKETGAALSQG